MKKIVPLLGLILAVFVLFSCQRVFTYSVFEELGLQRDVSTLPPEQQKAYAYSALASGDTAAMTAAYTAIAALTDTTTATQDPALYTLAAGLAISASGISETITDAIMVMTSSTDPEGDLTDLLDFSDAAISMLGDAAGYVEDLEAAGQGDSIEPELYVNAAAAILITAIDTVGGYENLDLENPSAEIEDDLAQAELWAAAGGVTLESLFGG